jgi:endonuclease YncB( thermonuclease family)
MSRRTQRLFIVGFAIAIVASTIALDHAGAFGYRGSDWQRFNRQSVRALDVIDGDEFTARLANDGSAQPVTIHLLGVDAPHLPAGHWTREAKQYLEARLKDRAVTLQLDGTQTRDASGALLAYIYVKDGDCLNTDIVRDGQAFADRRIRHTNHAAVEQVENEARKKKRGMWKELGDDQQPQWRREWLEQIRKLHPTKP